MNNEVDVIAGIGLDQKTRKSHWPARLDFVQSASGLFLGLFMWGHMAFVSTILISNDAMWWVTKMFEGQFVFGKRYPGIVARDCRAGGGDVRAPRLARHAEVSRLTITNIGVSPAIEKCCATRTQLSGGFRR